MMSNEARLYYTAPTLEAFENMKKAATEVWNMMGNDGGYRDSKIARIKDIGNVQDNFMYIFAMFDINNQRRVVRLLTPETKQALRERLIYGGNGEVLIDNIFGHE